MIIVRPFLAALGFLTIVPVPVGKVAPVVFTRALAFFPAVGVLLGLALIGVSLLLPPGTPANLAGVTLATALAILTGGLHLDGLADAADGLGGGRGDRVRTLAIMRDPRIGAHGAAALVFLLLAKVFALAAVWQERRFDVLVAFPALARGLIVPLIVLLPSARPEGLGKAFRGPGGILAALVAVGCAAGVLAWGGVGLLVPAAAALVLALLTALGFLLRLGGLTGDVYGAAVELAEVAFLAAACVSGGVGR